RARPRSILAALRLDLRGELRMFLQVLARVVLTLPDPILLVGEPRARLVEHLVLDAELEDLALARDALAVEDVEDRLAERRGDLVLYHPHPPLGAQHLLPPPHAAEAPRARADPRREH